MFPNTLINWKKNEVITLGNKSYIKCAKKEIRNIPNIDINLVFLTDIY